MQCRHRNADSRVRKNEKEKTTLLAKGKQLSMGCKDQENLSKWRYIYRNGHKMAAGQLSPCDPWDCLPGQMHDKQE